MRSFAGLKASNRTKYTNRVRCRALETGLQATTPVAPRICFRTMNNISNILQLTRTFDILFMRLSRRILTGQCLMMIQSRRGFSPDSTECRWNRLSIIGCRCFSASSKGSYGRVSNTSSLLEVIEMPSMRLSAWLFALLLFNRNDDQALLPA